jgi:predicted secreted protein
MSGSLNLPVGVSLVGKFLSDSLLVTDALGTFQAVPAYPIRGRSSCGTSFILVLIFRLYFVAAWWSK